MILPPCKHQASDLNVTLSSVLQFPFAGCFPSRCLVKSWRPDCDPASYRTHSPCDCREPSEAKHEKLLVASSSPLLTFAVKQVCFRSSVCARRVTSCLIGYLPKSSHHFLAPSVFPLPDKLSISTKKLEVKTPGFERKKNVFDDVVCRRIQEYQLKCQGCTVFTYFLFSSPTSENGLVLTEVEMEHF